jgi:hypothetical protein
MEDSPRRDESPAPSHAVARGVRFGCGFVVGAILAVVYAATQWRTLGPLVGVAVAAGLVFGVLSARWGDRFWVRLSSALRWWR